MNLSRPHFRYSPKHRRRRQPPSRLLAALLVTCATAGSLALLAMVVDPGPSVSSAETLQASSQGTVLVQGSGVAEMPSPTQPAQALEACTFTVDAQGTGDLETDPVPATGTFQCAMSDEAVAFGVPFSDLAGTVAEFRAITPGPSGDRLTLAGTSTLRLPDGTTEEDVGFSVRVLEGGVGTGWLKLKVDGFDGEPGDIDPGNGRYDMATQTLTVGSIQVVIEIEPSPTPSSSGSPSPTVTQSPSPTPTVSQSPSPTATSPSPTPTSPPPTFTTPPPTTPPPTFDTPTPTFTTPQTSPPPFSPPPTSEEGPWSSATLMAVVSRMSPDGVPQEADILGVVGSFPVAGLAWWQYDWHAYRCCPYPHVHTGVDMFAQEGTPLVASADGVVTQKVENSISGLGVEIQDSLGTQYFYAHLSAFAPGLAQGNTVSVGQVIGYVGNTGNAAGGAPHLHFEVQPNGIPVPPIPEVNGWLDEAEDRAFLTLEQNFPYAITSEDLAKWQAAADALGGAASGSEGSGGSPGPTGGAGSPGGTQGPGAAGGPDAKVAAPSGPMVAFAALALLALLIAPGIMAGRKRAQIAGPR